MCIVYISLSIIGRLVGVLGGSGFLHCSVGWLGVTEFILYQDRNVRFRDVMTLRRQSVKRIALFGQPRISFRESGNFFMLGLYLIG